MKQVQTRSAKADDATGQLKETEEWVDTVVPVDIHEQNIPTSTKIDEIDNNQQDGPWYILYWLDQYHYLHPEIKKKIQQTNPKPDLFKQFSDSVASLLGIEFIKDNSVIPVSDIATNITGYTYSSILDYILSPQNIELQEEMSIKTNNLFKYNMLYIKDDNKTADRLSTDSHGKNLITDSQHYVRMSDIISDLEQLIQDRLGSMYRVLKFIQSNISHVEFLKWRSHFAVEHSYRHVDKFGNLSETKEQSIKIDVLDTQDLPVS